MMRLAAIVLAVLALGCRDPWSPPAGAEPFEPPAHFREWWAETEVCSGLTGDFDRVTWWNVDELTYEGQDVYGGWAPPHNIYLTPIILNDSGWVSHEMLHDLLGRMNAQHDEPEWAACAGVVNL